MARQCEMMGLNRSTLYYEPKPISDNDLKVMKRIDEIYTDIFSTYGYRFMHRQLLEDGFLKSCLDKWWQYTRRNNEFNFE